MKVIFPGSPRLLRQYVYYSTTVQEKRISDSCWKRPVETALHRLAVPPHRAVTVRFCRDFQSLV